MSRIVAAFNRAMEEASRDDGSVKREEAAARLAHRMGDDVALQAEAAAFVVLHLLEPFGSVSRRKFEELTDRPLDEAVAEIRPAVGRIMELEDEALAADPAYRKIMGLGE